MINLDSLTLKLFAIENLDYFEDARIQKIQQPTRRDLIIQFHNAGETRKLYININPKYAMAYENLGQVADAAFQVLIDRMSSVEQTLRSLEEKFPEEIKTQLTAKAEEVENTLNATKDAFFEEFEEAHATDIETVKNTLIAQKNALIEAVDSSSK